jgi:hypothetical protein
MGQAETAAIGYATKAASWMGFATKRTGNPAGFPKGEFPAKIQRDAVCFVGRRRDADYLLGRRRSVGASGGRDLSSLAFWVLSIGSSGGTIQLTPLS